MTYKVLQLFADDDAARVRRVKMREAKVAELARHALGGAVEEEYVLELQVAVRDAEPVKVFDRREDLREQVARQPLRQRAASADVVKEVVARELHHDEEAGRQGLLERREQPNDARVVRHLQQPDLVLHGFTRDHHALLRDAE